MDEDLACLEACTPCCAPLLAHVNRLQKEYCPPLDSALVISIYSDYKGEPNCLEQARAVLAHFKDAAAVEQLTDFDPSGCSTQPAEQSSSPEQGDQASRGPKASTETDATSLTNGVSSLALSSSGVSTPSEPGTSMAWLQNLNMSAKEAQLIETFPTLSATTISFVFNKNKGDFEKCTDELLNHVLFEEIDGQEGEEKVLRKGIDTFAAADVAAPRGRKAKGKKKNKKANYMNLDEYARSSSEPAAPSPNKWKTMSDDVDFIATKVNVSYKAVRSSYHERGGSVAGTITALIESNMKTDKTSLEEETDIIVQNVLDLASEFSLDLQQAHALIRLTHPSSAAAHELAKSLTRLSSGGSPTGSSGGGGIQLVPRYAPLNLPDPDDEGDAPGPASASSLHLASPSAASFGAARHTAFSKASEYHRKGKSDPLMKAAAGYYGQIGRDHHRAYQVAVAAEADALVAAQSTPAQLDLHGVSVADAKRIARQRVGEWWKSLGEDRIRGYAGAKGRANEYSIVTGLGRHSDGGKAKIGPAVMKMLVAEGWRVEVGSGFLTVSGVRKV
ncbi:smr domain protein [Diplodia corticola]|uniref:Smr domain protein n=1 Tax=Diplodia corticola TaxID=236234 RepID=A0A1J9RVU2_9PEZI|nr:smr domain protein [Diplodia corticola]OJD36731.1 smr domain protein [Diplodia corticola]